jgi:hypothetical protein
MSQVYAEIPLLNRPRAAHKQCPIS